MSSALIERLLDQARHLGLVGHLEAGIEVGLERELAQQRQAERVDRADRDVAEAVAQSPPALPVSNSERAAARRSSSDDPLAHLGRGLARERDREDVGRLDAARSAG